MNNFYKKSKNLVFLVYLLIFFSGMLLDLVIKPRESFMESDIVRGIMGISMFFIGSHLLYFKKLWANDMVAFYEKHLQGKPVLYEKWLSLNKSQRYNTIMASIVGAFFVVLGLLTFIKSFY